MDTTIDVIKLLKYYREQMAAVPIGSTRSELIRYYRHRWGMAMRMLKLAAISAEFRERCNETVCISQKSLRSDARYFAAVLSRTTKVEKIMSSF